MTIFQERTPAEMRGRLFGMVGAVAWVAMPLGMLISGALIQHAGLRMMLVIIAASISLITIAILANPTLQELDPASTMASEDGITRDPASRVGASE